MKLRIHSSTPVLSGPGLNILNHWLQESVTHYSTLNTPEKRDLAWQPLWKKFSHFISCQPEDSRDSAIKAMKAWENGVYEESLELLRGLLTR